MLLALALIPVIGLLLFIYFNDKNEKEPFGFLIGLFFAGMSTITSAIILEGIGQAILGAILPANSSIYYIVLSFVVIGPAEELGKFIVMRLLTWHNGHFDYSYDAIVYAVFVSLGFAALENIGYVFSNGVVTAILRMFTSIPGHAGFAVFMGFFYGRSKHAKITNNKSGYVINTLLSMFIPIIAHGIYDAIVLGGNASKVRIISGFSLLLWIGFVIALYVVCIIIIIKSSRNDFCFITKMPKSAMAPAMARPAMASPSYQQPVYMQQPVYQRPAYQQPAYMQQPGMPKPVYHQMPANQAARPQPGYAQPSRPLQPVFPAQPTQPVYSQPAQPTQPVAPSRPIPAAVAVPVAAAAATWTCVCSAVNNSKFCAQCGRQRPDINNNWSCPRCMTRCTGKFCTNCGTVRP